MLGPGVIVGSNGTCRGTIGAEGIVRSVALVPLRMVGTVSLRAGALFSTIGVATLVEIASEEVVAAAAGEGVGGTSTYPYCVENVKS